MRKNLILGGMIATLALAVSTERFLLENFLQQPKLAQSESLAEYILQGADQQSIIADVNKVGGEVIFAHSVIQAVSVKLTNNQIELLKDINPKLQAFKDQKVEISRRKSRSKKSSSRSYEKESPVVEEASYVVAAPSEEVEKSTSLFASLLGLSDTGDAEESASAATHTLAPYALEEEVVVSSKSTDSFFNMLLNVTDQIPVKTTTGTSSLSTFLATSEGAIVIDRVENGLTHLGIDVDLTSILGMFKSYVDSSQVSWVMTNSSGVDKEISNLSVSFPESNGAIKSIIINGVVRDFELLSVDHLNLVLPIELLPGANADIRIEFDTLSSVSMDRYSLRVGYSDGSQESVMVANNSNEQGVDRDTYFAKIVNADQAHASGITGYGVTVAILDTGINSFDAINTTSNGSDRFITHVDVLDETEYGTNTNDENGHGTHLSSIIANSSESYNQDGYVNGGYNGIAPDVNLVIIRAFDEQGHSTYLNILKSIEYILENKDVLDIKVLNLSFSTLPSSLYWDDPLNQALMKLWDAGITVIASAGNRGSDAMTIGVPGNTPYFITVGATSDNYTPYDMNDDFVTSFSSAGPTYEGFVKPEIVAPGARIQGLMSETTYIREQYALYSDENIGQHDYFELSGTSQATAVTSGIVALMLQADPSLSPDDIKCRLISSARAATNDVGELAYSIFQQGAGLVDAMAAIESTESGCANIGLSIATELSDTDHFIGPVQLTQEGGDYFIPGLETISWSGEYVYAHTWSNSNVDSDSQLWRNRSFNSNSQLWEHTEFESNSQLWRNRSFEADSQLWRNRDVSSDSQLWRNRSFESDSQLWRNRSVSSNSVETKWVDHE